MYFVPSAAALKKQQALQSIITEYELFLRTAVLDSEKALSASHALAAKPLMRTKGISRAVSLQAERMQDFAFKKGKGQGDDSVVSQVKGVFKAGKTEQKRAGGSEPTPSLSALSAALKRDIAPIEADEDALFRSLKDCIPCQTWSMDAHIENSWDELTSSFEAGLQSQIAFLQDLRSFFDNNPVLDQLCQILRSFQNLCPQDLYAMAAALTLYMQNLIASLTISFDSMLQDIIGMLLKPLIGNLSAWLNNFLGGFLQQFNCIINALTAGIDLAETTASAAAIRLTRDAEEDTTQQDRVESLRQDRVKSFAKSIEDYADYEDPDSVFLATRENAALARADQEARDARPPSWVRRDVLGDPLGESHAGAPIGFWKKPRALAAADARWAADAQARAEAGAEWHAANAAEAAAEEAQMLEEGEAVWNAEMAAEAAAEPAEAEEEEDYSYRRKRLTDFQAGVNDLPGYLNQAVAYANNEIKSLQELIDEALRVETSGTSSALGVMAVMKRLGTWITLLKTIAGLMHNGFSDLCQEDSIQKVITEMNRKSPNKITTEDEPTQREGAPTSRMPGADNLRPEEARTGGSGRTSQNRNRISFSLHACLKKPSRTDVELLSQWIGELS